MYMKYLLLLLCFTLSSCCSILGINCPTEPIDQGPTPQVLEEGAEVQAENTGIIEIEAIKINQTTKEPTTKLSAKKIIVANEALKANKILLQQASEGKAKAIIAYNQKQDELENSIEETNAWKEKYEGKMSAFMIWIKGIGVLMIPLGLFGMFKVAGEWIWISVAGVCLIVTGMVVEWIEDNFIWILIGIGVTIGIAAWRFWVQQRRTVQSVVNRAEILKLEVKKLDNISIKEDHAVGTEILEKVFGEYHTEGLMQNDPTTKRMIDRARRTFKKENDQLA